MCTLIFFFFVSFNLTLSALATYLLARFILRARQDGARAALSGLAQETRDQFTRGRRLVRSTQGRMGEGGDNEVETLDPVGFVPAFGEKVAGAPASALTDGVKTDQ